MKKKLNSLVIFLALIFFTNSYAQEKIAFIDLNYVFNNSSAGKNLNKQIEDKANKINSEFKKIKEKIDNDKKKLTQQKNVLSKEEFNKKLMELEKNINEQNISISKKQNDLASFKNKARLEFSNKLKSVLEEYSKNNSIDMIFRKENLLLGKNSLDVTRGILDLFNKNVKKISVQ